VLEGCYSSDESAIFTTSDGCNEVIPFSGETNMSRKCIVSFIFDPQVVMNLKRLNADNK
jgi:hypothetical protein